APEDLPTFEDWLVRGNAPAPGRWSLVECIPAHVRFRPKEYIRDMRTRSVEWDTWTDAGGKRWRVSEKRKVSEDTESLSPKITSCSHENDDSELISVRYVEDIGSAFVSRQTPPIPENRIWRSVVARVYIDAVEARPLGKRTARHNDQARPTYVGRENARDLL